MKLNNLKVFYNYYANNEIKFNNLSLALGFFDGVHLGHKKVIKNCVKNAIDNNLKSGLITFINHPKCIINNIEPKYILDFKSRLKHIEKLNVDYCFVYDFNEKFLNLDYYQYIQHILINNFHPKFITTGFNHYFGKNREGTPEKLKQYVKQFDYTYNKIEPYILDNDVVSSSLIRQKLTLGEVQQANKMLSYNFYIEGKVIEGKKLGRTINFPTANFLYNKNIIQIPYGVYFVKVAVENKQYFGVLNFGIKPTINAFDNKPLCEVYIFDFNDNIYNKKIKVEFIQKIRDEKKFDSIDDLKKQISHDVNKCKNTKLSLLNKIT